MNYSQRKGRENRCRNIFRDLFEHFENGGELAGLSHSKIISLFPFSILRLSIHMKDKVHTAVTLCVYPNIEYRVQKMIDLSTSWGFLIFFTERKQTVEVLIQFLGSPFAVRSKGEGTHIEIS